MCVVVHKVLHQFLLHSHIFLIFHAHYSTCYMCYVRGFSKGLNLFYYYCNHTHVVMSQNNFDKINSFGFIVAV